MEEEKVYRTFTDLEVWQVARDFKKEVYKLITALPETEKYRLTDQLMRSVRSIPANISEGYGRFTYKDQTHFCIQARGSLLESLNHLIDAYDSNYINEETLKIYKEKGMRVEALLNGYISWLKKMSQTKP